MSPAKTAELQVSSLLCRLVWAPVLDGVHIITEYHVSLTTVAAMRPDACITIATWQVGRHHIVSASLVDDSYYPATMVRSI